MNGSYKVEKKNLQIFTCGGLKVKLLQLKTKGNWDGGNSGHQDAIYLPNIHDSCPVKFFKSRALKHEGFKGTIFFQILREQSQHGVGKVGRAFKAVAVIY